LNVHRFFQPLRPGVLCFGILWLGFLNHAFANCFHRVNTGALCGGATTLSNNVLEIS
jgi:hypothetical protein